MTRTRSSTFYDAGLTAVIGPTMTVMDDPEHRRMRLLLQAAFSRKQMRLLVGGAGSEPGEVVEDVRWFGEEIVAWFSSGHQS